MSHKFIDNDFKSKIIEILGKISYKDKKNKEVLDKSEKTIEDKMNKEVLDNIANIDLLIDKLSDYSITNKNIKYRLIDFKEMEVKKNQETEMLLFEKYRFDLITKVYLNSLVEDIKDNEEYGKKLLKDLLELYQEYHTCKKSHYIQKKNKNEYKTVKSLNEYLKVINKQGKDKNRLFYRGHGNSSYFLKPGTHRDKLVDEKTIILDYEHFAPAHDLKREKDIDMLIDMQHYEIPTRLLDWSLSPLYALFFACYDELGTNNENDAEVFIFDPWKYNNLIIDYMSKPHPKIHDIHIYARVLLAKGYNFKEVNDAVDKKYDYNSLNEADLKLPIAMVGDYHNPRNQSQKGTFTIQGSDERDIISLLHEYKNSPSKFSSIDPDKNNSDDILKIIRIPSSAKKRILEELNILNIHPYSIYPDPHGMSRYLKSNPQGFFKSRKI